MMMEIPANKSEPNSRRKSLVDSSTTWGKPPRSSVSNRGSVCSSRSIHGSDCGRIPYRSARWEKIPTIAIAAITGFLRLVSKLGTDTSVSTAVSIVSLVPDVVRARLFWQPSHRS